MVSGCGVNDQVVLSEFRYGLFDSAQEKGY